MSENNGGSAFPFEAEAGPNPVSTVHGVIPAGERLFSPGMTMRQYYAANSGISLEDANVSLQLRNKMGVEEFAPAVLIPEMVRLRLEYADAMVAAESAQ